MIKLSQLPKIMVKKNKRLGRGEGSGRGKTAGRGTKGQKARGTMPPLFEGGQLALIRRLPLYRGRGKNKRSSLLPIIINLKALNLLPKDTIVTNETLIKFRLLAKEDIKSSVKILGDGEIQHALVVKIRISKNAAKKIEAAGGKVESEA